MSLIWKKLVEKNMEFSCVEGVTFSTVLLSSLVCLFVCLYKTRKTILRLVFLFVCFFCLFCLLGE